MADISHPPMEQLQDLEYCIDSNPPWPETVLLAFQNYILMLGTTVMILSLLVPYMSGSNRDKACVIQTLLFVSGINTLLQTLFGTRLPAVVGGSFAYVMPILYIINDSSLQQTTNHHDRLIHTMRAIQGALIFASSIQIVAGYSQLWGLFSRFFSPLGMAPAIGLEKKIETLARITTILKDVIQNKDRIISCLQQPYSLDCIPVEAEYQKQFSELLMKAASDYGLLTSSVADFQWTQNFKEPPSVWGEMLGPVPVALASCTRFFEAMTAMRESFATLQKLRLGPSDSQLKMTGGGSDCVTPPPWGKESSFDDLALTTSTEDGNSSDNLDGTSNRRLSWPLGKANGL